MTDTDTHTQNDTTADADTTLPREVTISESYHIDPKENTFRTQKVKDAYGIDFDAGELSVIDDVTITVEPGQIILATGSSGAGKTTYCRALADELDGATFETITPPPDCPIIDIFPDQMSVDETQRRMALFGLGDAHLNLRTYRELSDGQQYRARLAYAATQHSIIFADEYCATLDRETANTISYSLRRQLNKDDVSLNTTFIFATTHRDIIENLQPDWLLDFDANTVKKKSPTGTYRSHSPINSHLPPAPKRTGRTSLAGII